MHVSCSVELRDLFRIPHKVRTQKRVSREIQRPFPERFHMDLEVLDCVLKWYMYWYLLVLHIRNKK